MPMYSFRCEACGEIFEEMVPMDRSEEAVCPGCGDRAVRSWKGAGAFSVGASSEKCACEAGCASGCGCGGACRCGQG